MLNISKATPDLTVGALNITVGDLEIITVTGPKDATGLITLTLMVLIIYCLFTMGKLNSTSKI